MSRSPYMLLCLATATTTALLVLAAGCGSTSARATAPACVSNEGASGSPASARVPPHRIAAPGTLADAEPLPAGYVEMTVTNVVPGPDGHTLLLASDTEHVALPMAIGDTEAHAIRLRLDGERFQRPLTHDLLDAVMRELGGQLVRVQVTKVREQAFVATLLVRNEGRLHRFDARPSDAIALAVGNHAPIFVSRAVLESAGMPLDAQGRGPLFSPPVRPTPSPPPGRSNPAP